MTSKQEQFYKQQIADLQVENVALKEQVAELLKVNAELAEKVAKLSKNSFIASFCAPTLFCVLRFPLQISETTRQLIQVLD